MDHTEIKHAYWMHAKIPSDDYVNGFYYSRKCSCSSCGYESNVEKPVCPECGAVMDKKTEEDK